MNEQIQKFAEQAGFNFRVDCVTDNEMVRIYQTADKVEKLAELIVRECAKVLEIQGANTGHEQYYYGASLIEEHFGVEE